MIDDYFNVCYTWNYTQMFIQFLCQMLFTSCCLCEWVSEIGCLTSQGTIFQLYMRRHIDVQAAYYLFWHIVVLHIRLRFSKISIKILPPSCLILSRTYHEVGDKRKDIHGVILSVVCYLFIHSMSKSLAKNTGRDHFVFRLLWTLHVNIILCMRKRVLNIMQTLPS